MKKLSLLMMFFLMGSPTLWAVEAIDNDQAFMRQLNEIRNPFEDGIPKPIAVKPKPVVPVKIKLPHKPVAQVVTAAAPVALPALKLQGVIVGEDVHQAIINDQVVALKDSIEGAQVISVTKEGAEILFQGKKFFLKVE